ncbi:uncharacterized protein PITG_02625 [Phytophthora infestans T30-4]|uniref:Uncharacterized protein n=1 Tax=Phytophthora infestans (strain T30-4) TaxID=403677 RepID=D0MWT6_PHYIT|nr:uncharacterized protein PITG_02625 [Phytophthora infestans T30-4]EEY64099.1 conserved hypothetical protein [Phytophthora infestans T30-4]|eukprot:XP_002907535.1 conserved hypothetical protein [Phytophthora infestans T30-4]
MIRTGSSALTLALTRKNNSLVALLLRSGASRATIPREMWQELDAATWLRAEVWPMLSTEWTVVWNPSLHRHFPPAEREKCRLIVYANTSDAMRYFWWIATAFSGPFKTNEQSVRWRYLSEPLLHHIIEFAVFLW